MISIPLKSLLKLETYFVYHLAMMYWVHLSVLDVNLVWCLSDILATASLSVNLGKLSPN